MGLVYGRSLSRAQQSIWLSDSLATTGNTYNIVVRIDLVGAISIENVVLAIKELLKKHELLHSKFRRVSEEVRRYPVSLDSEFFCLDISHIPKSDWHKAERKAEVSEFDLERDLPIRFDVLKDPSNGDIGIVAVIHHIVIDKSSIGIFIKDLAYEFGKSMAPSSIELELPKKSFDDYVAYENDLLRLNRESLISYYEGIFEGYTQLSGYSSKKSTAPLNKIEILPNDLNDRLLSISRSNRCTQFSLLCAVSAVIAMEITGNTDIVLGIPIDCRPIDSFFETIGPFINTALIRVDLAALSTYELLLRKIKKDLSSALEHKVAPIDFATSVLRGKRKNHYPYDVLIEFNNEPMHSIAEGGVELIPSISDYSGGANSPLTINFSILGSSGDKGLASTISVRSDDEVVCRFINNNSLVSSFEKAIVGFDQRLGSGVLTISQRDHGRAASPQNVSDLVVNEILSIFNFVLKKNIRRDSNFFDFGGNSILVLDLLNELEHKLNLIIPPRFVFEFPTPVSLAAHVSSFYGESTNSTVLSLGTVHDESDELVICFHPLSGLSWCYSPLVTTIDSKIVGIQSHSFSIDEIGTISLKALAEKYMLTIIELCSNSKSVSLLGWSFGGLLAYEVAVKLYDIGIKPVSLVLLDSYAVSVLPTDQIFSELSYEEGVVSRANDYSKIFSSQMLNYTPSLYKGDVHLIASKGNEEAVSTEWSNFVLGTISSYSTPYDHFSMMRPAALKEIGQEIVRPILETNK